MGDSVVAGDEGVPTPKEKVGILSSGVCCWPCGSVAIYTHPLDVRLDYRRKKTTSNKRVSGARYKNTCTHSPLVVPSYGSYNKYRTSSLLFTSRLR